MKNLHQRIIKDIYNSWKDLRHHPRQNTVGVDGVSIKTFSQDFKNNISKIRESLKKKEYSFEKLRPVKIIQNKKEREILIQTVSNRIVGRAILKNIQPKLKKFNSKSDYSIKKESNESGYNGIPLASEIIQSKIKEGYHWVFETDIKSFFDCVPKDEILKIINKEIADIDTQELIEQMVRFQVDQQNYDSIKDYFDESGIAQGSSISPLLATIYLSGFDKMIEQDTSVFLVRYVDDFVILCKTEEKANEMYALVQGKLEAIGLEIHELNKIEKGKIKTRIVNSKRNNFTFLGLNFNYLDIDISSSKKEKIVNDLKDILYSEEGSLLEKSSRIIKKLEGVIKQYKRKHYKTEDSLKSLAREADKLIAEYYERNIKKILGFSIEEKNKLNLTQVENLRNFLGLNVSKKVLKF